MNQNSPSCAYGQAINIIAAQGSMCRTFLCSARHAACCNRGLAAGESGRHYEACDAFDLRPGAAGGVIPDNLQRIPTIFSPS